MFTKSGDESRAVPAEEVFELLNDVRPYDQNEVNGITIPDTAAAGSLAKKALKEIIVNSGTAAREHAAVSLIAMLKINVTR